MLKPFIATSIVASIVLAVVAISNVLASEADVRSNALFNASGRNFYKACDTGLSGDRSPLACRAVVSDIAYQLSANGFTCDGGDISDTGLLIFAENWIRSHAVNADYPAKLMITNAFMSAFPCNRRIAAQGRVSTPVREPANPLEIIKAAQTIMDIIKLL